MLKKRTRTKPERPKRPETPITSEVLERSEAQKSVEVGDIQGLGVAPTADGDGVIKMSKKPMRIMNVRKFEDRSVKIYVQDGSHLAMDFEWFSKNQPKMNDYIMLRDGKLVCMSRDEAIPLSR